MVIKNLVNTFFSDFINKNLGFFRTNDDITNKKFTIDQNLIIFLITFI